MLLERRRQVVSADLGARAPVRCHGLVRLVVGPVNEGRSDFAVGVSVRWQHVVHACDDLFLIHSGDTSSDAGLFDTIGWSHMSGLLCIGCVNSFRVLGITPSIPVHRVCCHRVHRHNGHE